MMHRLLTFFSCLLILISRSENAVEAVNIYSIQGDLAEFNITCEADNCAQNERGSLSHRPCLCGIQCVQLGTCCVDSIYADVLQPTLKPACRLVNKYEFYFMIDTCPSVSKWASLCNNEWNGENDIQKLVPVTSLLTTTTYKNYYCFRCHESGDEFLYWNLWVEGNFTHYEKPQEESKRSHKDVSLNYNKDMGTWMAMYDENIGHFPVTLAFHIPQDILMIIHNCEPNVISDCSNDWYDEEVRSKCQSYMSIKEVVKMGSSLKYKNIHCALCNFENLNDIKCRTVSFVGSGGDTTSFSFTHLLDINRSDGEIVGKIQKCSEDKIWDPFTKKCRELTCALPGFKIKDGKCTEE